MRGFASAPMRPPVQDNSETMPVAVALAEAGFCPVTSRPSITVFETNGSTAF